jgi:hypothetical protein
MCNGLGASCFIAASVTRRRWGAAEVETFLTPLAVVGRVSAATQNRARSALLFLCKEVPGSALPWLVLAEGKFSGGARTAASSGRRRTTSGMGGKASASGGGGGGGAVSCRKRIRHLSFRCPGCYNPQVLPTRVGENTARHGGARGVPATARRRFISRTFARSRVSARQTTRRA